MVCEGLFIGSDAEGVNAEVILGPDAGDREVPLAGIAAGFDIPDDGPEADDRRFACAAQDVGDELGEGLARLSACVRAFAVLVMPRLPPFSAAISSGQQVDPRLAAVVVRLRFPAVPGSEQLANRLRPAVRLR